MFKKLRNRLIIINVSITSVILVIVFATIYLVSIRAADNRPPRQNETFLIFSDEVQDYLEVSLRQEKDAAARELLITLIVSGVIIEFFVALASYYLAEESIKPIKNAYESQKIFIANASHEMKTPIAAISANLEAADVHGNKWIKNVETETAKLTKLNNDLLTLARTGLVTTTKQEEAKLSDVINKSLDGFEPRLGETKLTRNISDDGVIKTNPDDFNQILGILVDNAIKYSKSKIKVGYNHKVLTVENDGKTIPKDKLGHIFDRFYQVDKTSDGVGLGLSIAKSLSERNKWKLVAESERGKTKFILTI